jgi:hypothetical protein
MMKYVGMMILIWIMGMALHAIEPVKNIDPDSVWQNIGELKQQFGTDKAIPEEMQVAFYAAIAYYPMLSDVPVKVKQRDIKTTMQCRPRWDFFLRKKDKRHYKILVNNKVENNEGVLFEHLPFNARVGVFGHELAHVLDYSEKSNWQIIRFGVEYLNDENRRIIENRIDQLAIEHRTWLSNQRLFKLCFRRIKCFRCLPDVQTEVLFPPLPDSENHGRIAGVFSARRCASRLNLRKILPGN